MDDYYDYGPKFIRKDPMYDVYQTRDLLIFTEDKPIGHQLVIKRAHDELTQSDLCRILGIPSVGILSEIETGKRKLPRKYQDAIARYLYESWFDGGELVEYIDEHY